MMQEVWRFVILKLAWVTGIAASVLRKRVDRVAVIADNGFAEAESFGSEAGSPPV
jgi:hypothetical protein